MIFRYAELWMYISDVNTALMYWRWRHHERVIRDLFRQQKLMGQRSWDSLSPPRTRLVPACENTTVNYRPQPSKRAPEAKLLKTGDQLRGMERPQGWSAPNSSYVTLPQPSSCKPVCVRWILNDAIVVQGHKNLLPQTQVELEAHQPEMSEPWAKWGEENKITLR